LTLVGSDFADSLLYGVVQARTGRFLDELSPFDRRFRRVAGRRNVYVWMLVAGVCAGRGAAAYLAVSVWAAATAAVHGLRALMWTRRGATIRAEAPDQPSVSDPAAGALVSDK